MKTVEVSVKLADMLRERIDESTNYKSNAAIDKRIIENFSAGRPLSKQEEEALNRHLYGRFLKLFLEAREQLVIPEDALHRLAADLNKDTDELHLTFRYEEFYAYQFVDKLNDIVRRAQRVRNVFAKEKASSNVIPLCREAYQAYVNGYFAASVALVRSLIEASIKDRLKMDIGNFRDLNKLALERGLYSRPIWQKIDQIRRSANSIIHGAARGKTAAEAESLRLIGLAQEVLQDIHRRQPKVEVQRDAAIKEFRRK